MNEASFSKKLFRPISSENGLPHAKVSIVGVGQVGMAGAYNIALQGIASEIALVDVDANKLKGELMDLQHGQAFTKAVSIKASTDYSITSGSRVCIVTAGARQKPGETRLDLVQKNVTIFKGIIPQLVKYSPDTILVIVSNPVDILAYLAWKISGLPRNKVIGSGTMLDSSRFRFLLSERLQISPSNCHGYIIGEHGDSSVAVWSGVNVAGTRLKDLSPEAGEANDPDNWIQLHKDVVNSAYEIIKLKGYTSWAIGTMVGALVNAILKNQRNVYALSTLVQGQHNITEEVFLSVPCVVGEFGITHLFCQNLNQAEQVKLQNSAKSLRKILDDVQL